MLINQKHHSTLGSHSSYYPPPLFFFKEGGWILNLQIMAHRVLARPCLMTLCIMFPIHVNFPIRSRCVLKAIFKKKNSGLFYMALEVGFFSKDAFYVVYACCIWSIFPFFHDLFLFFMFLFSSFINYFCHITFYTHISFSIFVKDFCFSSFPLIF